MEQTLIAVSSAAGLDGDLGSAHERTPLDLVEAAKLNKAGDRRGEGDVFEGRVVVPPPAGQGLAPGLGVLGDADLEVLDAATGGILARVPMRLIAVERLHHYFRRTTRFEKRLHKRAEILGSCRMNSEQNHTAVFQRDPALNGNLPEVFVER